MSPKRSICQGCWISASIFTAKVTLVGYLLHEQTRKHRPGFNSKSTWERSQSRGKEPNNCRGAFHSQVTHWSIPITHIASALGLEEAQYSTAEHEEPDSSLTFRKVILESDLERRQAKPSPNFKILMAIRVSLNNTA